MKAGCCGGIGGIFSTFSTLRLSKTAGFCEQDVKSLAFFLYRSVVQLKKEREKESFSSLTFLNLWACWQFSYSWTLFAFSAQAGIECGIFIGSLIKSGMCILVKNVNNTENSRWENENAPLIPIWPNLLSEEFGGKPDKLFFAYSCYMYKCTRLYAFLSFFFFWTSDNTLCPLVKNWVFFFHLPVYLDYQCMPIHVDLPN